MKKVIFLQDFATKKKGDEFTCDGMLASHLVHIDKVAKYAELSKENLSKKDTVEVVKKAEKPIKK